MDADVESFLRDKRSLIQIIGRAARNTESQVILYADTITRSMQGAMDETNRRRALQEEYNKEHGITPQSVKREVTKSIVNIQEAIAKASKAGKSKKKALTEQEAKLQLFEIEREMQLAAERFDFEKAIALREQWRALQGDKANSD
jgi:excinuclease ABC subunit B